MRHTSNRIQHSNIATKAPICVGKFQMGTSETENKPSPDISENVSQETREEMLSRHRLTAWIYCCWKKEISELHHKEMPMKKAAAKGSKAEQKAKEKQVEDGISNLSANLKQKHVEELASVVPTMMNAEEGEFDNKIAERFQSYCKDVESTAAWGGQLELRALTHCLKKHIMIYSGSFPNVEMGSINLSYHQHAFGLGEHYNSVVPINRIRKQCIIGLLVSPNKANLISVLCEKYETLKDLGAENFRVARLLRNKKTKELLALKYIKREKKKIYHRNLKLKNIFLGERVFFKGYMMQFPAVWIAALTAQINGGNTRIYSI
ncbi:OLC1v1021110C1 [Oldenlandia corymbosa var. corymbosa]|uniref:OLC1v1021110C1 n=1 Tax=Oldenlandia corymbosa var. corymbosa TaxID=529605 RepID=A0AAV1BXD8_OLDCO|nr:OLC1v1021110C1 [Oldenlandia corymbosa var. corymbosa]